MLAEMLAAAAADSGKRMALVTGDASVDYQTLWRQARGWAALLAEMGVAPGDRVLVQADRAGDLVAAQFGIWLAGATAVPVGGDHPPSDVASIAASVGAASMVVNERVAGALRGRTAVPLLDADAALPAGRAPVTARPAATDALLLHTSGTTGRSKCVRFTAAALVANARTLMDVMRWTPDDRCLTPVPAALPAVLATCLLPALAARASVYCTTDRTPGQLVRSILRHRATILYAVPYTYELLADARATIQLSASSALRLCVAGSAPSRPDLVTRFHSLTGLAPRAMYCSSEAGTISYVDSDELALTGGSVGRPLPGVQVRIVGAGGNPVRPGEAGEVVVSGPLVGAGYLGQPATDATAFRPDGVYTGDLGSLDAGGRIRLHGRLSEVINCAGYSVDPREVEDVLLAHPVVREAHVYGEDHPTQHQRVVALVVPGGAVDAVELTAHCADRLAAHKVPARFTFVAELPRNPLGKVVASATRASL